MYDIFYINSLCYLGAPNAAESVKLEVSFYPFWDTGNTFKKDDLNFSFTGGDGLYRAIFRWNKTVVMKVTMQGSASDQTDKEKMFQELVYNYRIVT